MEIQNKCFFVIMFAFIASSIHPNQFKQLQNDIGISARFCNPDELLVDADGWKLKAAEFVAKGFTPVRIFIDNKTDRALLMSEHSTPFVTDIVVLTSRFKRYENGRPLGLIAGMYGIASIIGLLCGHLAHKYQARRIADMIQHPDFGISVMGSVVAVVGWLTSMLYSPFYWHRLREANRKLPDVLTKALHPGPISIPPHQSVEKIILAHSIHAGVLEQIGFRLELFDEADGSPVVQFYIDLDKRK